MDVGEVPELEDCSDIFADSHSSSRSDTRTSVECVESASKTELDKDTRMAFKKALQGKMNPWKSSVPQRFITLPETTKSKLEDRNLPNWITDDLLAKIQSEPMVNSWFQNPQKASLLTELQKNPKAFYDQQTTKEDVTAIQKFAEILGEHFENLASQEEKEAKMKPPTQTHKPLIEEVLSSEEKELQNTADKLLSNEEIRCALQDKNVYEIIESLRTDPEKGQMLASCAPSDVKEKLSLLIRNGILGVE